MRVIVVAFLAVMAAGGAAPVFGQGTPTPETVAAGIPPLVWALREMSDEGGPVAVPEPTLYTVRFLPDGEVRLRVDCNRGTGQYRLDGEAIAAGPFATTRVGCPNPAIDATFLRLLEAAATWALVDDELVLSLADGTPALRFGARLDGVVWEWVEFAGGNDETLRPADPSAYTVAFVNRGDFAVRVDCNSGGGTSTVDLGAIDLRLEVITEAVCADPELDRSFLGMLEEAASFIVREGDLYLGLPADAGILRFAPRLPAEGQRSTTPGAGAGTEGSG